MAIHPLIEWTCSALLKLSYGTSPVRDGEWITPNRLCVLLLDCSESMQGTKFEHAKAGTLGFAARALASGYAIGVVTFASNANLLCSLGADMERMSRLLLTLHAAGTTNMAAAIDLARMHLAMNQALRSIAIVTDGMPDSRETTLFAAQQAKEEGIRLIAIGTENADLDFLRALATAGDLAIKVPQQQLAHGITSTARLLPGRSIY